MMFNIIIFVFSVPNPSSNFKSVNIVKCLWFFFGSGSELWPFIITQHFKGNSLGVIIARSWTNSSSYSKESRAIVFVIEFFGFGSYLRLFFRLTNISNRWFICSVLERELLSQIVDATRYPKSFRIVECTVYISKQSVSFPIFHLRKSWFLNRSESSCWWWLL